MRQGEEEQDLLRDGDRLSIRRRFRMVDACNLSLQREEARQSDRITDAAWMAMRTLLQPEKRMSAGPRFHRACQDRANLVGAHCPFCVCRTESLPSGPLLQVYEYRPNLWSSRNSSRQKTVRTSIGDCGPLCIVYSP